MVSNTYPIGNKNVLDQIKAEVSLDATNLITNGNFANGTTGWAGISALVDGVAEKTATAQYQNILCTYPNPTSLRGHKIYMGARYKADSASVGIGITDGAIASTRPHSGSGEFETKGVVHTVGNSATLVYFRLQDNRASGWTKMYLSYAIAIDLTAVFGAGNEPTVEQMDAILSHYPNSWFDGTVNLAQNSKIIPYLLDALRAKANAEQEAWITPTLVNGYRKHNILQVQVVTYTGKSTCLAMAR